MHSEKSAISVDTNAPEMRALAALIRDHVMAWLEKNHPELLAGG